MGLKSRDSPAIPDGDIPFCGVAPRFFSASLAVDPWVERVVAPIRRTRNLVLDGQVCLWEVEKKRID